MYFNDVVVIVASVEFPLIGEFRDVAISLPCEIVAVLNRIGAQFTVYVRMGVLYTILKY